MLQRSILKVKQLVLLTSERSTVDCSYSVSRALYRNWQHNDVNKLLLDRRSDLWSIVKRCYNRNCCVRNYSTETHSHHTNQKNVNPIDDLQKYVAVPLLKNEQRVFNPTAKEVRQGEQIFWNRPDNEIKFLKSAVLAEHLPKYTKQMTEVAFIGRSNVGKSSLIQVLLGGKENVHVRTSKTPGHTKMMNFFQVGDKLSVVDMPGYGYRMPSNYVQMVEQFLQSRPNLSRTLFLVDGSVGVTETDVIGLNMMEDFQIPYTLVLTKIDKAKPAVRIRHCLSALKYIEQTMYCLPQPFLVSSLTGEGVQFLQAFIAHVTGNLKVAGQ